MFLLYIVGASLLGGKPKGCIHQARNRGQPGDTGSSLSALFFSSFSPTTTCHNCSYPKMLNCHHRHHHYHYCHPQVVFTAKLTVSDKSVKWSFQDQVTPNSLKCCNLWAQASIKALQPQNMVSFGPCVINPYTLLHISTVTSGSSPTFLET